ncbi:hypothetical protein [Holospora curviuscula]|uniref:hypothetical protein n=1 Tax=Holospora curviuscula TaxID=1082868 RepID=UPI0013FDF340|nr:hypothetical protein [Holospora curviuscula]
MSAFYSPSLSVYRMDVCPSRALSNQTFQLLWSALKHPRGPGFLCSLHENIV